jgi:hypothetical protein
MYLLVAGAGIEKMLSLLSLSSSEIYPFTHPVKYFNVSLLEEGIHTFSVIKFLLAGTTAATVTDDDNTDIGSSIRGKKKGVSSIVPLRLKVIM